MLFILIAQKGKLKLWRLYEFARLQHKVQDTDLIGKRKKKEKNIQKEGEGKVPLAWSLQAKLQQRQTVVCFGFMRIRAGQKLDQNIRS